jgi:hypothetical protein
LYSKGLEPSELPEYDSRLVAFTQELPFLEGKHLSLILEEGEGRTELLEHSHMANNLPDHQVYMASLCKADDNELGPEYDDELLADVSTDERTVNTP